MARPEAAGLLLLALLLRPASGRLRGARPGEVEMGNVRIQALSPTLVRIEPKGPKGFEDQTTFMVVNRSFPRIPASAVGNTVHTEYYDVILHNPSAPSASSCSDMMADMDVASPARSANFPNGQGAPDADACCDLCSTDPTCTAWVYAADFGVCYPLASYGSLKSADNRAFGFRSQSSPSSCSDAQQGMDVTSPARSANFPNGQGAPDADACCDLCSTDSTCTAWVYAADFGVCYPLASYGSLKSADNRAFGLKRSQNPLHFEVHDPSGAVLFDSANVPGTLLNLLRWPVRQCSSRPCSAPCSNGYDFSNLVRGDTYVFLLGDDLDGWTSSRVEFANLCGPVPVLPDYAYGTWFTWWHPYTQAEAEDDIEKWEENSLPLDVWGLDINWRFTSDNRDRFYTYPNTDLFPDFDGWFSFLHGKKLRTYFNDHPFPIASRNAGGLQTSPSEVQFRWQGLTSWMARGLSFWWYDFNWGWSIPPPMVNSSHWGGIKWMGLTNADWGSHVYLSIVAQYKKLHPDASDEDDRPITLSKFGIPDARPGMEMPTAIPGHHRYPVWWTGDQVSLQASVETMVQAGVYDFKPFLHSDCGSDARGSDGSLLRWTAHCAFGSILRFHGADHRPWTYKQDTMDVIRAYLVARYRLLPTLIAAGREATATGFPLAARCDLLWLDQGTGAARNDQYVFLRDLLVAPITDTESDPGSRSVWIPQGEWQDVWSGEVVRGPQALTVSQPFDRQPMYYRRDGGIFITSQESVTRVDDQKWESLTLDIFPSQAAITASRDMHEKKLSAAPSTITLTTNGQGQVQLLLSLSDEGAARHWVVRAHLLPGQSVIAAHLDGAAASTTVIQPNDADPGTLDSFPFGGMGSKPAPHAGPFVIIEVGPGSSSRTLILQIQ